MAQFIYHNRNPKGDTVGDCVVRAISLAINMPYEEVENKLYHTGALLGCESLCACCYGFLLAEVFKCRELPCDGLTVAEFADLHPYGVFLVRVPEHLTCVIDDCVYDIWDCRDEPCDIVWRVD